MYRQVLFILLVTALTIISACQKADEDIFAPIMEAHNSNPETTTLVIKRLSDNKTWISNTPRAKTRYIPASTSKIPHTLIALETNFAEPDTPFKWDGQKRTFKSWNQDQTLTQAYRRSAVWVYQEMAQTLGPEAMTSWLTKFNYGNHDIGAQGNVTQYWLTGPLAISVVEQIEFLTQLSQEKLPLSKETYAKALPIFKNEIKAGHTLYAKTGWMHDENTIDIGWFVGWVETVDPLETYVFALNMDMPNQGDQKKRKPIVITALTTIGAWEE